MRDVLAGGLLAGAVGVQVQDADGKSRARSFSGSREPVLPRIPEAGEIELRRSEYAVLGMTAEGAGPVMGAARHGRKVVAAKDIRLHAGRVATSFGWRSATRRARTGNGRMMRFFTLEDPTGTVEAVLFPDAYREFGHLLRGEGPYYFTGRVEIEHDVACMHVTRVIRVDLEEGDVPAPAAPYLEF